MSTVMETIKSRRSVRKYLDKPVEKELLEKIAEAGIWAATGRGNQGQIVIAITDPEQVRKYGLINGEIAGGTHDGFYGAPAVFMVISNKAAATYLYDGCLVLGNMMLEAKELGLGSCWIHRCKEFFEREEGKELLASLGIEGDYEGIGNLIVGYADGEPAAAERKDGRIIFA